MLFRLPLATIFSTILAFAFGQVTTSIPLSLKKCPVKGNKEMAYELNLDKADDGSTSVSWSANVTQVVDKGCTYTANFEMKNGGVYLPYLQTNGNLCELLHNIIKSAWERFKHDLKPPLEAPCTMNPGSYSISGFQIKKDEANFAIPMTGQFRTDLHFYCDNAEVVCVLAEFLIEVDEDIEDEW